MLPQLIYFLKNVRYTKEPFIKHNPSKPSFSQYTVFKLYKYLLTTWCDMLLQTDNVH